MRQGEQVLVGGYGGPDRIEYVPQPRPEPHFGEVLVEVVAAGVSHMDTFVREGTYRDSIELTFPTGQGTCFAGIVRAVGQGVTSVRRGAAVVGRHPAHAAQATWALVGERALVPKPERLEWETAGGLYLTGATALSIVRSLHLGPGDVVAITAAAGGVGHLQSQLARIDGATVLGIAGAENHDYLRSIGVRPVAHGDGLEARLRDALEGRALTALIDNYGRAAHLVDVFGVPEARFRSSAARGEVEVRFFTASADDPEAPRMLAELVDLVEHRGLRPLTSRYFAFHQVREALAEMDTLHSRGKVVLGMHTVGPEASYLEDRLRTHYAKARAVPS